nr:MAG TPA: hypothetical protein [Bacteriophage sp.]
MLVNKIFRWVHNMVSQQAILASFDLLFCIVEE